MFDAKFWDGKRVLVTGHTGFKGAWLCKILVQAGANVVGYALAPPTQPNVFELSQLKGEMNSILSDVRNLPSLREAFMAADPEIVLHLAAQPLVRESYKDPHATYETNVMGTVNVLECVRHSHAVRSFLNVTTDKVYQNREWEHGYRECDPLDGFDPYSNSKSCAELVTHSYKSSFFADGRVAISTARAGNVIGGGDFAADRIVPDCVRAVQAGEPIVVRNPHSIRPYQHVLEPLFAYLMIARAQYEDGKYAGYYNVGPDDCDCVETGTLAKLFCTHWGEDVRWIDRSEPNAPHEASFLKLDCSKLKAVFGWQPKWHINDTMRYTCEWYKGLLAGENVSAMMTRQINAYLEAD